MWRGSLACLKWLYSGFKLNSKLWISNVRNSSYKSDAKFGKGNKVLVLFAQVVLEVRIGWQVWILNSNRSQEQRKGKIVRWRNGTILEYVYSAN
jgi:hypothetical protein